MPMECWIALSEGGYEQVNGKAVPIPEFEEFEFFIHKNLFPIMWIVSEHQTGGVVGKGRTRKEAIYNASTMLWLEGFTKFERRINNSIKKHGMTPPYRKEATDDRKTVLAIPK